MDPNRRMVDDDEEEIAVAVDDAVKDNDDGWSAIGMLG